ncbi:hypothetical protein L3V82_07075 [Thiotrichales bacterium 19S3-7]|nr:hypothetical protein [Thiotrichales bacterium 19S3-7]MCF6801876.1 hypothetical protein [Thiotrichales bacterium 19S3-11]
MTFILKNQLDIIDQFKSVRDKEINLIEGEISELTELLKKETWSEEDSENLVGRDSNSKQIKEENLNLIRRRDELVKDSSERKNNIEKLLSPKATQAVTNIDETQITKLIQLKNNYQLADIFAGKNNEAIKDLLNFTSRYEQLTKGIDSLEEKEKTNIDSLKTLKAKKEALKPVVERYIILKTLIKSVKKDYKQHLMRKDKLSDGNADKRIAEKFLLWDKINLLEMNYNTLADALLETHQGLKSREPFFRISDSRRIFLQHLSQLGIGENLITNRSDLSEFIETGLWSSQNSQYLLDVASSSDSYLDKELGITLQSNHLAVQEFKKKHETDQKSELINSSSTKNVINAIDLYALEEELKSYHATMQDLDWVNRTIDANNQKLENRKDEIVHDPKAYINNKIRGFESDKEERQKLILADIKECLNNRGAIIDDSKKYLQQDNINYFLSLKVNDIYFNDIKKTFESLQVKINDTLIKLDELLTSLDDITYPDVLSVYTKLKVCLGEIETLKQKVEIESARLVYFLLTNSSTEIKVPSDLNINFSGYDLRAVDLSRVKYTDGTDYDFSKAKFNKAILGSVSVEELRNNCVEFQTKLGLEELRSGTIIDILKTKDKGEVIDAWNQCFPFYPINPSNERYQSAIEQNLLKIEKDLEKNIALQTVFPTKFNDCDLSQARFIGDIHGVFHKIAMPKDLKDVNLRNCRITEANFDEVRVNENTRLPLNITVNLKNIINDASVGKTLNLGHANIIGKNGARLPQNLKRVNLDGANVSNLELDGGLIDETTVLNNVTFENVTFKNLKSNNGVFKNCIFKNCTFETIGENERQKVKFENCTFEDKTIIKGKMFNSVYFTNVSFQQLHIDKDTELKEIQIGGTYKLDALGGDNSHASTIFIKRSTENNQPHTKAGKLLNILSSNGVNKNSTLEVDELSANQFLSILEGNLNKHINRTKNTIDNTDDMRNEAFHLVKNNIAKIKSLEECNRIQQAFKNWQASENGKEDHGDVKWRLFNSYGKFTKKTEPSAAGVAILKLVDIEIRKRTTEAERIQREQNSSAQLPVEYKCLHKAFNHFNAVDYRFTDVERNFIDNIKENQYVKPIASFGEEWKSYIQKFSEIKGRANASEMISESSQFVKRYLNTHINFDNILNYVNQLYQTNPEKIDSFIDELDLLELQGLSIFIDYDIKTHTNTIKAINDEYDKISLDIINIFVNTVNEIISGDKLNNNEKECFLMAIAETPFSKQSFLDVNQIKALMKGKEGVDLFSCNVLKPHQQLEFFNELLMLFDESFYFDSLNQKESFCKIKKAFFTCFKDQLDRSKNQVVTLGSEEKLKMNSIELSNQSRGHLSDIKNDIKGALKCKAFDYQVEVFAKKVTHQLVAGNQNRQDINTLLSPIANIKENKLYFNTKNHSLETIVDMLNQVIKEFEKAGLLTETTKKEIMRLSKDETIFKSIPNLEKMMVMNTNSNQFCVAEISRVKNQPVQLFASSKNMPGSKVELSSHGF